MRKSMVFKTFKKYCDQKFRTKPIKCMILIEKCGTATSLVTPRGHYYY